LSLLKQEVAVAGAPLIGLETLLSAVGAGAPQLGIGVEQLAEILLGETAQVQLRLHVPDLLLGKHVEELAFLVTGALLGLADAQEVPLRSGDALQRSTLYPRTALAEKQEVTELLAQLFDL